MSRSTHDFRKRKQSRRAWRANRPWQRQTRRGGSWWIVMALFETASLLTINFKTRGLCLLKEDGYQLSSRETKIMDVDIAWHCHLFINHTIPFQEDMHGSVRCQGNGRQKERSSIKGPNAFGRSYGCKCHWISAFLSGDLVPSCFWKMCM